MCVVVVVVVVVAVVVVVVLFVCCLFSRHYSQFRCVYLNLLPLSSGGSLSLSLSLSLPLSYQSSIEPTILHGNIPGTTEAEIKVSSVSELRTHNRRGFPLSLLNLFAVFSFTVEAVRCSLFHFHC